MLPNRIAEMNFRAILVRPFGTKALQLPILRPQDGRR
jgi:hypothetical protein